jgi:hypothetical protein
MNRIGRTLVLLLGLSVVEAGDESKDTPATPAEQYKALLKEYHDESVGFRKAKTDEERKAAVERLGKFAPRFVELAEKHPGDTSALGALLEVIRVVNSADSLTQTAWEINKTAFPAGGDDHVVGRAVTLLVRDHVRSDKVGLVCERMRYGMRKEYETFLRAILRDNPNKEVQALACLALAQYLNSRLQTLDLVKNRPELARRYEGLFGKDYFNGLQRQDRDTAGKEVETLLEKAAETYGTVKLPFGGTVGERAQADLFEIRHLSVGKVAQDIEGDDQDGKRFKLSDYRGKVVLLDFWSEY